MTTTKRFTCDDLFNFNGVNLDYYTETVCFGAVVYQYLLVSCNCLLIPTPDCSTTSHFICNTLPTGQNIASQQKGQARKSWVTFWERQKVKVKNGMAM